MRLLRTPTAMLMTILITACSHVGTNTKQGAAPSANQSQYKVIVESNTPSNINASSETTASKGSDVASKVGIVEQYDSGATCLRTQNRNLVVDTPILIIPSPADLPQKVFRGTITAKLTEKCVQGDSDIGESNDVDQDSYQIQIKSDTARDYFFGGGLAIVDTSRPVEITRGFVNVDLDNDGENEYFRSCTSMEGVHYSVWSGKPLIGRRVWHRYYYLRYATQPTCKKRDFEGPDE